MWKHNLTSIIEMLTVLDTVHVLIGERLASTFVILKTKNLVTRMLEDGYEEECKQFFSACRSRLHFMFGVLEYVDGAV
jgi:3-phosphoglycerate kinase